ncbi:MAG: CoA pyrophosphatase [Bacteroidetes bacterium]|nr:CoA pyrophosphatase [Bacteroidota bacterium]
MNIYCLKKLLQEAFTKELPGKDAHVTMAPKPLDLRRFITTQLESPKKSGVLLLFYPDGGDVYFPLIKRPQYPGVHSGQVGFPGGKMESTDPDILFTALREAEEEIGIDAGKVEVLGCLSNLFIPTSNFLVSPVVGFVQDKPKFVPEQREVSRIITTEVVSLFHPEIRKQTHLPVGAGMQLETPYFEIDGEMVWGATAMILSELIQVLNQKGE